MKKIVLRSATTSRTIKTNAQTGEVLTVTDRVSRNSREGIKPRRHYGAKVESFFPYLSGLLALLLVFSLVSTISNPSTYISPELFFERIKTGATYINPLVIWGNFVSEFSDGFQWTDIPAFGLNCISLFISAFSGLAILSLLLPQSYSRPQSDYEQVFHYIPDGGGHGW